MNIHSVLTLFANDRGPGSRPGRRRGLRACARAFALAVSLATAATLAFAAPRTLPARAAGGLEVIRAEAVSEFPEGIRFLFEARSDRPIEEVVVRFAVSGQSVTQYNYLELSSPDATGGEDAGKPVAGEYFHRTGQRDRYVPPGAEFTYFFEVLYGDGQTEATDPATFIAHDSRYTWESLTTGAVTVFYHGPVRKRAEFVADIALQTFANMGPITGADTESPLRIVMYNNNAEMIGAVSIRSLTSARELITEGQAFAQHNLVIVQAGADRAAGTISHEVTHILVGRATRGAVSSVPLWVNEGLAEYGNLDPGLSYVRFLEWAVDTDRLVPIVYLDSFPADPNLTIVAYGEARSIVEFMIDRWGPGRVSALLSEFSRGTQFAEAMRRVYGFDPQELDRQWRVSLGAKPYEPAAQVSLPTPVPQLQLTPFTIEATPAITGGGVPTPVVSPDATPAGSQPPVPAASPPTEGADAPQPTSTPTAQAATGGGCSAGRDGRAEASMLAVVALPLGLLGVCSVRRFRPRRPL